MNFLRFVDSIFIPEAVFAHCDIPCGIYKSEPSLTAAETVVKMVEKIENPPEVDEKDPASRRNFHNNMTRFVMVKEQHAELCKKELLILWTDFFKDEHLKKWPDLHEKIWRATKLCSENKREVSAQKAQSLLAAVREIGEIFEEAKSSAK
jgi:nickel superoxide dismutase